MSEKHLPRHRRSYSKEFQTAIQIIDYLKTGRILLPTPVDLETGKLADVIGLGMGTITVENIPVTPANLPLSAEMLKYLIDD